MADGANDAAINYVGDGGPDGTSLCLAGKKASVYGETPVVQASAVVAVTGTVSLTTTINAVLTAIRNFGIIA